MKVYQHIIFDLDHTLWDFTANSNATLKELYLEYAMLEWNISETAFLEAYQKVNNQMWLDYNHGRIGKEVIRRKRFQYTLALLGIEDKALGDQLNEAYLEICPTKGYLIPFALEILIYLSQKYTLHILTNGFSETQAIKIKTSGLECFFQEIINAESCGFLKPDKRAFDYTLSKIKGYCADSIMIGDDLYADALGAKKAGLDHVYFNPQKRKHRESLLYEIACLSELKEFL